VLRIRAVLPEVQPSDARVSSADDALRTVASLQIAYWFVSGAWPLLDMRSFERVTGAKRERWLVRTVSVLILAVAATLADRVTRHRDLRDMRVLGVTSAGGVGLVSLLGPILARISPVYFIDAAIDLAIAALWVRAKT
jgi:hypothetical protein